MSITLVSPVSPRDVSAETFSTDFSHLDNDALQHEIRGLASLTAAAMCRLLLLVAEMERRGAWADWGVQSCAHWLSWQCGFSLPTAREHVRVARSLAALPRTIALFQQGELTYAKVRAITRVATAENEELLVAYALDATASQLELIVRGFRRQTEVAESNEAHDSRRMTWVRDGKGVHVLTIRMTAEERAIVEKALKKAAKDVSAETSLANRPVEALVTIARSSLAEGTRKPKDTYLVNLTVSAETLADDADGECHVDGHDVSAETARRLSCDAPVVTTLVDGEGVVLKMGRRARLFTGPSRAAVLKRDKGTCAFPGCTHRKWIDVHHIRHWTQGGLTNPENGIVLCGFHHRLVHEGGFSVDSTLTFRTPAGQVLPTVADPLRLVDVPLPSVERRACVSRRNGALFDVDASVGNLMDATAS
jgi:hypothetical protein